MDRQTKKRRGGTLLLALCVAGLIVSAAVLLLHAREEAQSQSEFEALAATVRADTPDDAAVTESTEAAYEPSGEPAVYEVLNKYTGLYAQNHDLGGWIRIEGTVIDYPVMFTPDDVEKYLHRSFEGEEQKRGVPFIGAGCSIAPRSENIIIYGHHMKSGSMFAALVDYASKDYWETHKTVYFSTLYEEAEYEVFAAFETDITAAEGLRCYDFINAANEVDFLSFVEGIKDAALYDTGVDVSCGDALLTLSTCAYHTEDGRFVVMARKTGGNGS